MATFDTMSNAVFAPFVDSELLGSGAELEFHGPRWWWGGELDVEGLALASVGLVASSIKYCSHNTRRFSVFSDDVAAAFDSLRLLRVNGKGSAGFAPFSGFFRTQDGWIRTHANYPHHLSILKHVFDVESVNDLHRALSSVPRVEAENAIFASGGVAAAVRTRSEWTSVTGSKDQVPWVSIDFETVRGLSLRKIWNPFNTGNSPLSGLRVLDLSRVIAGPTATRVLGFLGADVLRVDPPHQPELLDHFIDTGFDKRSAVEDISSALGRAKIDRLLEEADIVLLGYGPSALERLGLEPTMLQQKYPGLIVLVLDAWAGCGSWSRRKGFDSIVQAACGIADLYSDGDGKPGALPVQALDHSTGYGLAASAILMAHDRYVNGRSGVVHASLICAADLLWNFPSSERNGGVIREAARFNRACCYGDISYVPPPFRIDDKSQNYGHAPVRYGSSKMEWIPRGGRFK